MGASQFFCRAQFERPGVVGRAVGETPTAATETVAVPET
jgi:hypothetical protein